MVRSSEKNRLFGVAAAALVLLAGCPIYEDECDSRNDCARGYVCDPFSRRCEPVSLEPGCRRPDQCDVNETCTPDFTCRPGSCDFHGCVRGYVCGVVDSAHACVLAGAEDAAVSDSAAPSADDAAAGGSGPGPVDAASDAASDAGSDAAADSSI